MESHDERANCLSTSLLIIRDSVSDVLDEMVKNCNETVHLSTKLTPIEASKEMNENKVWLNLYSIPKEGKEPKYSVGDKVRITKKKTTFEKGYTPRWTEEVFTIDQGRRNRGAGGGGGGNVPPQNFQHPKSALFSK